MYFIDGHVKNLLVYIDLITVCSTDPLLSTFNTKKEFCPFFCWTEVKNFYVFFNQRVEDHKDGGKYTCNQKRTLSKTSFIDRE